MTFEELKALDEQYVMHSWQTSSNREVFQTYCNCQKYVSYAFHVFLTA